MKRRNKRNDNNSNVPQGANIAGVPVEEPYSQSANPADLPPRDPDKPYISEPVTEYIPRHMRDAKEDQGGGDDITNPSETPVEMPSGLPAGTDGSYIPMPDGSNIAPNGAVIRNPWADRPEITPDHEYTDEQQDYDILIM